MFRFNAHSQRDLLLLPENTSRIKRNDDRRLYTDKWMHSISDSIVHSYASASISIYYNIYNISGFRRLYLLFPLSAFLILFYLRWFIRSLGCVRSMRYKSRILALNRMRTDNLINWRSIGICENHSHISGHTRSRYLYLRTWSICINGRMVITNSERKITYKDRNLFYWVELEVFFFYMRINFGSVEFVLVRDI